MARWLLTQGHYLNTVPPTEWEYKETSRETGRQVRRVFHVPMYLDPKDMADWNSPDGIVVTNGNNGGPRDIQFVGEPTPDMRPMDKEAEEITASLEHKWLKRPEDLIGDYSQSIILELTKQMTEVAKGQAAVPAGPVSKASVSQADFEKLQGQVAELMALNEELKSKAARRA